MKENINCDIFVKNLFKTFEHNLNKISSLAEARGILLGIWSSIVNLGTMMDDDAYLWGCTRESLEELEMLLDLSPQPLNYSFSNKHLLESVSYLRERCSFENRCLV